MNDGVVCEITFCTGVSYIAKLTKETNDKYEFSDVLRLISTPIPIEKDGKKDLSFVTTMLPYRIVGENANMILDKKNPMLLNVTKVTLFSYLDMYNNSVSKFKEAYLNSGLEADKIN